MIESTDPIADELADEIVKARLDFLKSRQRPKSKLPYMYLSGIHTCMRNNYYQMVAGDKRPPFSDWLQGLFESGEQAEKEIVRSLLDYGFEWVSGQQAVEIQYKDQTVAKGKIDGMIRYKKQTLPVEIKSMSPWAFEKIKSVDDLFESDFTTKYVRQLLMYMYGNNVEQGLFIITNRSGQWKVLPMYLGNYIEVADRAIQLIEGAWDARLRHENGEKDPEPPRIKYHPKICGSCDFAATVCFPEERVTGDAVINDDPELEALLQVVTENKDAAKKYEKAKEEVNELFKRKPDTTVGGRFMVTPKVQKRTYHNVKLLDEAIRKSIAKESEVWVIKVIDLEKKLEQPEGE